MQGRFLYEQGLSPRRALSAGAVLANGVTGVDAAPVVLYVADLEGDEQVLGCWQRTRDAVKLDEAREKGLPVLRRTSGGSAVRAGTGIVYVALCLRHGSALIECPPDRLLNRNLRGLLSGLGSVGPNAQYAGGDWINVARQPAALVGWDRTPDGRVLVEAFIARTRSFVPDPALSAYPKRKNPPFQGKKPITLAEAWEEEPTAEDIAERILRGHEEVFSVEWTRGAPVADERRSAEAAMDGLRVDLEPEEPEGMHWSKPREIAMGFLSAGLLCDDQGLIVEPRLAGDFFADRETPRVLGDKLAGKAPSEAVFADALAATFTGGRVIEGVKDTERVLEALVAASAG